MKVVSEFMEQLNNELMQKKGMSETSASQYIRTLYNLNGKLIFNTLSFLKQTAFISARISEYAASTQKNMYSIITSVLSLYKDKAGYKKPYNYYFNIMMDKSKNYNESDKTKKTQKQEDNWLSWEVILEHQKQLSEEISKHYDHFTAGVWDTFLSHMILSLYTMFAPRRNQDYQFLLVVKKPEQATDKNMNYIVLDNHDFVFNRYKTAKTHGQQVFQIPDDLFDVILNYLHHHPIGKTQKTLGTKPFDFLVHYNGEPLTSLNSITRILNRIIGKRIGATMLRHIYLSNKYDIAEMKKDADEMGHNIEMQRDYIKE